MKKKLIAAVLLIAANAVHAEGDYKPFVMFDFGQEKDHEHDSVARDYINANVTVGVKGPNKIEYSIKSGLSQSDDGSSQKISNNVELKIKKSYALTDWASPYVALRLGEKFKDNGNHFYHWAVDTGVKFKLMENLAFDTGLRYRDSISKTAFHKAEGQDEYSYQSLRYHGMLLLDLDKANTLGLRYTRSNADYYKEEREGWRVHYQHNY